MFCSEALCTSAAVVPLSCPPTRAQSLMARLGRAWPAAEALCPTSDALSLVCSCSDSFKPLSKTFSSKEEPEWTAGGSIYILLLSTQIAIPRLQRSITGTDRRSDEDLSHLRAAPLPCSNAFVAQFCFSLATHTQQIQPMERNTQGIHETIPCVRNTIA